MIVNGREYPMWGQFVENKENFIGREVQNIDMGMTASMIVTDIRLEPNGDDSAMFVIEGKDVDGEIGTWFSDVHYIGIGAGEDGWITFSTMYLGEFRIKNKEET